MILKPFFFSILLLTVSSISGAATVKKKVKKGPDFDFGLNLTNEHFVELDSQNTYDAELYFKYRHKFNKHLGLILSPHIDLNRYKNSKDRSYLLRTENSGLYANYNKFSLTAGFLSHSFGLSQLFSPLNFVDTASYWSPFNAQKISSPTLRFTYKTKAVRLFTSYMPKRFENLYPGNNTPFIPTKIPGNLKSEGDTYLFPETANYSIEDSETIDDALSGNFVGGIRLKLDPFLTQLLYYRGVDTDPSVDLNLNLTALDLTPGQRVFQIDNPIGVIPIYQKVERLGLSVRYTLPFKWRLLYEGNISKGDENVRQGYRESQTHTAGLEWGVPIGNTLLLGVLQAYKSKNSSDSSLGLVSPFREAYLFGANWKYKKYDLSGGYFVSKSLKFSLYNFKVGYKINKNFKFNLSGNILEGELIELLSGLLDRDTVSAQIQYNY